MNGRTWKNLNSDILQQIRSQLVSGIGIETEIKNPHELWRINVDDSVFIAFKKGTLYHTPSNKNSTEVLEACQKIDTLNGTGYLLSDKDYLLGLDETGKGEITGPIILVGAIFPNHLFKEIVTLIGSADTKKNHRLEYWNELFDKLDGLKNEGFNFIVEKISPKLFDKFNVNRLLDLFYQKIILNLLKITSSKTTRIVLDDYGAKIELANIKSNNENEFLISPKAEDHYIEAKAASLISKKIREEIIYHINQFPEYQINNLSIRQGNVGNPQTIKWLRTWHSTGNDWPWFIKKSFKTITEIGNKLNKVKKNNPELRNDLLSPEFIQSYYKGTSKEPITIKCPECGQYQSLLIYDFKQMFCESCSNPIEELQLTLRYHCGSLIIDEQVVKQKLLIKDLEADAFLENYSIYIPWNESLKQNPEFRKGLLELQKLEQLGRLDLKYFQFSNTFNTMTAKASESNSIILTSNHELKEWAKNSKTFTIFIKN